MNYVMIIAGDFRPGRVSISDGALSLRGAGGRETVMMSDIDSVRVIGYENRHTITGRLAGIAVGGVIGGIATGALAGGLTGPAGAAIGAVAGGVLAVKHGFQTCRVTLKDGRSFIASATQTAWDALKHMASHERALLESR